MDDLAHGAPKPLVDEIVQLEPADEIDESKSPLPEENPLKTLFGQLFLSLADSQVVEFADGENVAVSDFFEVVAARLATIELDDIKKLFISTYLSIYVREELKANRLCNLFGIKEDSCPFVLRPGVTKEMWNMLIVKFCQLRNWLPIYVAVGEDREKRNEYVIDSFIKSISYVYPSNAISIATVVARKVAESFQGAIDSAVSTLPLSKFFTASQSAFRLEFISAYVIRKTSSAFYDLHRSKKKFDLRAKEPFQELLRLLMGEEVEGSDIEKLSRALALKSNGHKLNAEDPDSADDVKAAIDELNRLLRRLDATVRKVLNTTLFEFVLKFNDQGQPVHTAQMTIPQYFDTIVGEWNGWTEEGSYETCGQRLQALEASTDRLRKEFFATMTDKEVDTYRIFK
jgi:hypothetical protein